MPDEQTEKPPRGYTTKDVEEIQREERAQRKHGFVRRNWGKLLLLTLVVGPLLVLTIWTAIALAFAYSTGDRVGYVQKFSRKGWICKTWEGELAMVSIPGSMPEKFYFSVRDDAVAQHINGSMGKRVSLSYEQHKGLPTDCFGETDYFVTAVRVVPE